MVCRWRQRGVGSVHAKFAEWVRPVRASSQGVLCACQRPTSGEAPYTSPFSVLSDLFFPHGGCFLSIALARGPGSCTISCLRGTGETWINRIGLYCRDVGNELIGSADQIFWCRDVGNVLTVSVWTCALAAMWALRVCGLSAGQGGGVGLTQKRGPSLGYVWAPCRSLLRNIQKRGPSLGYVWALVAVRCVGLLWVER